MNKIIGHVAPGSSFSFTATSEMRGMRIDSFLSAQFSGYSRTYFQKLITEGKVQCNQVPVQKASQVVETNDTIMVTFPEAHPVILQKEITNDLGVSVVHEHPHFLIINKPAGLLVHTTPNQKETITLVDWLLKHFSEIKLVGQEDRPGIVHRLDEDTSGLMIIPRNSYAHAIFESMFRNRTIKKTYRAVVHGHPDKEGIIDFAIGRNQHQRNKMTHVTSGGRSAHTRYKVLAYYKDTSLVEAYPLTGRTHQIRVHFAAIGHPLVGDAVYGKPSPFIARHALHATGLTFTFENTEYSWHQEPPHDLQSLIHRLETI